MRKHPTFLHTKALSDYFSTLASFRDELARFRSDSSEDHNEEYLVKQRFAWESRLGQLLDALAKNQDSDLLLLCAVQISELTEEFADIVFDAIEKFIVDNPEHPNGYRYEV